MADLYLAHHLPLELFLGVTRKFRISLYEKATGGDTVLGRPTEALSQGPAEDWTEYPFVIAGIGPAAGGPDVVQLRCEWNTTNPAVLTLTVGSAELEAAIALTTEPDPRLIWTIAGRRDTGAVVDDEVILVHGPVTVYQTAIRAGMSPLA